MEGVKPLAKGRGIKMSKLIFLLPQLIVFRFLKTFLWITLMGKFFVELIHMKFPKWFYQVQQTSWWWGAAGRQTADRMREATSPRRRSRTQVRGAMEANLRSSTPLSALTTVPSAVKICQDYRKGQPPGHVSEGTGRGSNLPWKPRRLLQWLVS